MSSESRRQYFLISTVCISLKPGGWGGESRKSHYPRTENHTGNVDQEPDTHAKSTYPHILGLFKKEVCGI